MYGNMVDIQSATAENKRGKKKKKRPQRQNIMACPLLWGGQIRFGAEVIASCILETPAQNLVGLLINL